MIYPIAIYFFLGLGSFTGITLSYELIFYLFIYSAFFYKKITISRTYLILFIVLQILFILNVYNTHSMTAAVISYMKYLVPFHFIALFYLFKNVPRQNLLNGFVLCGYIELIIYTVEVLVGSIGFRSYTLETGNYFGDILRGTGLFGNPGYFAFILATVIFAEKIRRKNQFIGLSRKFIFGVALTFSFSYRVIIPFFVFLMLKFRKNATAWVSLILLTSLAVMYLHEFIKAVFINFSRKIEVYLTLAESARSESYRVMFEFMSTPSSVFLGEGVGTFGGAEAKYTNSPVYSNYDFNWYWDDHLTTTDTYYPHLFVELGTFTACLYLLLISVPVLTKIIKGSGQIYIFLLFLVTGLVTFSINEPVYCFFGLTLPMLMSDRKENK